jgi:pimeloyl-ACP methyl ester carboxylesterase
MWLSRAVHLVLGAVLLFGGAAVPPASGEPTLPADQHSARIPDDQPLPGYTVDNPTLAPVTVAGRPSRVLRGVHGHAGYTIEVPPTWNGRLLLWAHGYRGEGKVLRVDPPGYGLRQQLLDEGYAWAASSYSDNGYDVRSGVLTTHDLATLFARLVDPPSRVFLAGVSMGGHVVVRSMEQYPGFYAGALPICGALGDRALFDYFLDYQVVAQALAGVRAYPVPPDYLTAVVPRIEQALGLTGLTPTGPDPVNDRGAELRAVVTNRTGGPRPGADVAFAYWKDFLFRIGASPQGDGRGSGPDQVATNVGTSYSPGTPVDLNAAVQRVVPADPLARFLPTLTTVPQVFGTPTAPVLSLHGLGDEFVPFAMEQVYAAAVGRHGRGYLLAQRAIRTVDHCEFDHREVGTAWRDLVRWVDTGQRPAGDVVDDPAVVAAPDYGCQFSDPEAYRNPPRGSTRRLLPPCPPPAPVAPVNGRPVQ